MAIYTHIVTYGDLGTRLNLKNILEKMRDVKYKERPFRVLLWCHKRIRCTCMVYDSGKIICHGEKKDLRRYARILQKMGYAIRLKKIIVLTRSAKYVLRERPNLYKLTKMMGGSYEPEIFQALEIKRGGICFLIYKSGKVIITGIANEQLLDDIVNPTLLEIECL